MLLTSVSLMNVFIYYAWMKFMQEHMCKYSRKWRRTKEPIDESERGEWKSWLKFQHQKPKITASDPITSWEIDGETVADFIFGAPKSLQMVIAAMKLKDAYSLEEKIWPT